MEQQQQEPPFTPASPFPLASFEVEAIAQISDGDVEEAVKAAPQGLRSYLKAKLHGGRRGGLR